MNPTIPQTSPTATPAPLTDIVAPVGYIPYPWWVIAFAVVLVLVLLGVVFWWFFFRKKVAPPLTARQEALRKLEALRPHVAETDPYAFAVDVSDVLRYFIERQYDLAATTQTSLEFLNSIREREVFGDEEKAAIALFLEKADLIKFARATATAQESESLLETAFMLVKEGERKA